MKDKDEITKITARKEGKKIFLITWEQDEATDSHITEGRWNNQKWGLNMLTKVWIKADWENERQGGEYTAEYTEGYTGESTEQYTNASGKHIQFNLKK